MVILVLALITVGILQAIASNALKDSKNHLKIRNQTRNMAIVGISSGVVLSIIAGFTIFRAGRTSHGLIDNSLIVASSILLLIIGGYSADSAISLQCDRSTNDSIYLAWYMSSISAVSSLITVFLTVLINTVKQRSKIGNILKGKICPECPECPNKEARALARAGRKEAVKLVKRAGRAAPEVEEAAEVGLLI